MTRNPETAWRRFEDEVLIIAPDSNKLIVLNDTAARVWELLGETEDPEAIAAAIVREFLVEPEAARADVRTFLDDLRRRGLVVA